jgi:KDO2-lipid IV(A) lauroyltransferase
MVTAPSLADASVSPAPLWMRAVAACVARLPWAWMRPLGAALGAFVGGVLRIRRAQVARALADAGIRCRPGAVYASLGTGLCELLWLAGRPRDAIEGRYRFAPGTATRLQQASARGRGVVVATAHVGNWDLAACATAHWLARSASPAALHVITKRLSWRALDAYWQRLRASRGVALIDARRAYRAARDALDQGNMVAMLVDQVPERSSGVASFPFLGTPARHDLAPATLAARAGAPIAVALSHRCADGAHELEVIDVLDPPEPHRDDIVHATQRIATTLERFVRTHPAQWLWLHRRWKVAPADTRVAALHLPPPGAAESPAAETTRS